MTDASDNVNNWPGFVHQVNKAFLLIRDLFGYAIPGAVFLGIGFLSKRLSVVYVQTLLNGAKPPIWLIFVLLIVACYVIGDVMAAIAYTPIAIWKWGRWKHLRIIKLLYPIETRLGDPAKIEIRAEEVDVAISRGEVGAEIERGDLFVPRPPQFDIDPEIKQLLRYKAERIDWLRDHPTEVTGDLLAIRSRHPELFLELDRRETLLILSASNAVAFFGGAVVFYWWKPSPQWFFVAVAAFLVLQFCTGISHLRRVRWAVRCADTISQTTQETIAAVDIQSPGEKS